LVKLKVNCKIRPKGEDGKKDVVSPMKLLNGLFTSIILILSVCIVVFVLYMARMKWS